MVLWQGNCQIYGHIRCIYIRIYVYTVLVNPANDAFSQPYPVVMCTVALCVCVCVRALQCPKMSISHAHALTATLCAYVHCNAQG